MLVGNAGDASDKSALALWILFLIVLARRNLNGIDPIE